MADQLKYESANGIGTILLNRPDALNAFSPEMTEALLEATEKFERDPDVRCVVLRAAGEHFQAGGDVKALHRSLTEDRERHFAGMERRVVNGHLAIHRLRRMQKPVLAVVQGAAAGFGVSLVAAADLAIAADNSYFTLAYCHIGLSADGGASYFLPRLIGERRAMEVALLGERISAQKALEWGLINWIAPAADLDTQANKIAQRLAAGATKSLGLAKTLFRNSLDRTWDEQSAREAETIAQAIRTEDHLEGVTAFVEKRKPRFAGR